MLFKSSKFGLLISFQCQYSRRQSLNRRGLVTGSQTPHEPPTPDLPLWVKGGGEIIRRTRLFSTFLSKGGDYSRDGYHLKKYGKKLH